MRRSRAITLVLAACVLPRVAVAVHEKAALLLVPEKSDIIARLLVRTGTFGFVPGEPSAYTQPLYGWFLATIYWTLGRNWWSLSTAQIAVSAATAVLVYEIGRRYLTGRIGLIAALLWTLQPYLVWHDLHVNREILDQLLGAGMFALALVAAGSSRLRPALLLGAVTGVAILSNTRLVALPIAFGLYLLWRRSGWIAALLVPVLALVMLAPWMVRNKAQVGCVAITTDARALWKANNLGTYDTLRHGLWIDDVPDIPQRQQDPRPLLWYTPQEAGTYYDTHGVQIPLDECAQEHHYEHLVVQFLEHHPVEKVKLMVQATEMLWDPRLRLDNGASSGSTQVRRYAEPLYVIPLYLLAIAGLFLVTPAFRVLAGTFLVYETLAAWVFAGTTRYRVPWDFVLALLAAAAIDRMPWSRWPVRRPPSQ
ncbi:MAG: glycosyltransferase family 39 protein [Actinomycetes bacterium]